MASLKFVLFSTFLTIASSANISYVQSCNNTSPSCLKELIQSALPKFVEPNPKIGLQSLDPFVIDNLTLALPGNLQLEFRQGTSNGLRNCIIDSARLMEDPVDKLNNTLNLQFHCNLTIKGKYKSNGQLLMFVIKGDGNSVIKCKNIKIQFFVKLGSTLKKDGKKHLEIKRFNSSHQYEGQVHFKMTNLIQGNPTLGNLVVEFMNSNWKMVAEEFGKPIVDFGISSILKNIKKILEAIPQEVIVGNLDGFHV